MKKQNGFQKWVATKILGIDKVSFIENPSSYQSDDEDDISLQTGYQNSLYISRAIEVIQDAVSSVDFELFRLTGIDGEFEEVPASPLIDLLYKPNPLQTKSEFWRILVINLKLSGEVFIQKIHEARTLEPKMLVILNAKDMTVKITTEGVLSYEYHTMNGEIKTFTADDIIHIKNPNPTSQLRGFSILRPLLSRVEAEIKSTEYQTQLFGHNGNPDGLLTVKGVSDPNTLKTVKASFYNSFRGKNESNRVAVIGGEANYTPLNSAANTLDFIASKNNVRDEVFMALGVPKSLITSDDVNRANADAGLQQFMQFTIAPLFRMILEVFNERLVIPNYGEEYYLDTNKLVTEDRDLLIKEATAGINKWLFPNEVRDRFGYEPFEGGDVMAVPSVFQFNPSDSTDPQANKRFKKAKAKALFNLRPNHYKKLKHIAGFKQYMGKKAFIKASGDPIFKLKFSQAVNSVRDKGEGIMKKESKVYFKEQLGRVLAKLNEVGEHFTTANDIFDMEEEKKFAKNMVLPVYTTITVQAGNVALSPLKMITGKANYFVMNSVLYKKLEHRAKLFSDSVTSTSFDVISAIVADNMNEGVGKIAKILKEQYVGMSTTRAERIARTEAGYMTSLGSEMAYQESDVVDGKEWMTTGDGLVRDEHVQNDGEIVGKYDAFSNGEHFPAESSINCRCTIAPVVKI